MLNIPAEIMSLFKSDSVRKNFRVHFPNGENPDLTNTDIIADSVQFTESICSKDVLQFGLAESPRIQFECVNVQNIYGMKIECGIEVDTSSLTSAEIAQIQGSPGDGVLVLEQDSDVNFGYYRVPYGVFTVTSCPRSAGAMWRRRVEAYGKNYSEMSPILRQKLSLMGSGTTLMQNVLCLMAGERGDISDLNVTAETVYSGTASETVNDVTWEYNSKTYKFSADFGNVTISWLDVPMPGVSQMMRFTCNIDTTQIETIYEDAQTYGIPPSAFRSVRAILEPALRTGSSAIQNDFLPFDDPSDSGYIYPYTPAIDPYEVWYISSFGSTTFKLYENGTAIKTYTLTPYVTNADLDVYSLSNPKDALFNISVNSTSEFNAEYGFIDGLNMRDLLQGFAELNGMFCLGHRGVGYGYVPLSKSSPISVDKTEYANMWWDEYNIAPIGSIKVTYRDTDLKAEQTIEYEFGNGASKYDMTSNYLLKNLSVSASSLGGQTVEEYVTGLLDTYFIPNLQDIAFTPVQLEALGLPYLEPGDFLQIDDGNGGTVETYIMNRMISGEQFLQDDIESKGGEIIGNARSA